METKRISYKSSHGAFAALWWHKVIWAFLFNVCALQVLLNCYLPDLSDFLKQAWASILGAPTLSPKQRCCRPFRSAVPGSAAAASTGTRSKCTFSAPSSPAPDGLDQKLWGGLRGVVLTSSAGILTHAQLWEAPLCLSLLWTRFTASAIMVKLVDLLVRIFLNIQDKTHRLLTK